MSWLFYLLRQLKKKSILPSLLLFIYLLHYIHSLMKIAWPDLFLECHAQVQVTQVWDNTGVNSK